MTELLKLEAGANELQVSIHTLRAWIYQRRIPFVRLGRRVLLRREDIEAMIKKGLVEARKEA